MRGALFTLLVVAIGLVVGSGLATGVSGGAMIVLVGALFGGGFSGIGISIALRTGSAQAAQAGFLLFFPLLFLAPAFAPLSIYSDWLRTIAELNPVTYILRGLRELMLSGWDWEQIGYMLAAVGGFTLVTTSTAVWALARRTQ
jgi:ABC-2 type transport system permease protein